MNQFGNNIRKAFQLALLGLFMPLVLNAQTKDMQDDLRRNIKDLLGKYIYLSEQILPDNQSDPARPFIQLFRNANVRVVDDLSDNESVELISVRDYTLKIKNSFPQGITSILDLENIKIGDLPADENTRMVVEVKVRKTVEGSLNGQPFRRSGKVIFSVGFDLEDGQYRNFLIHGITPLIEHDQDIIISFSPSYNRIYNKSLIDDSRFEIPWEISISAGIRYQYMLGQRWGFGVGVDLAEKKNLLLLDKFDPLKGHDPNLIGIEWKGEFYYLELPFYGVYQYKPFKKLTLEAHAGAFAAYSIFMNIENSGTNMHSLERFTGVVSDPFNYENISNLDLGLTFEAGLGFAITPRLGFTSQAGYKHGIIPLEKDTGKSSPYGIYQGQFNPLFHKSGSSGYSQSFHVSIGFIYRVFGKKYF